MADVGADFGVVILSIGKGFNPNCSRILLKQKSFLYTLIWVSQQETMILLHTHKKGVDQTGLPSSMITV